MISSYDISYDIQLQLEAATILALSCNGQRHALSIIYLLCNFLVTGESLDKEKDGGGSAADLADPLPEKMRQSVTSRLSSDAVFCVLIMLITFGVHVSTGEGKEQWYRK